MLSRVRETLERAYKTQDINVMRDLVAEAIELEDLAEKDVFFLQKHLRDAEDCIRAAVDEAEGLV